MFEDYLNVMIWLDVRVCFPFTLLAIGLCRMVQFDNLPSIYYTNLLTANAVQLITLIATVETKDGRFPNSTCLIIYGGVAMVSLYLRMVMALERCFFVIQLSFIRQTKYSVIICVLVWVICMLLFPLLIFFRRISVMFVFALIPSIIFLLCPIGAFISLPRAASVSAEGKRRIIATFVLLLINYSLTTVPPVSFLTFDSYYYRMHEGTQLFLTLFLLSPFMDLFLFVFMREGPVDNLLTCLCCCCKMETPAVEDGSRFSV
ncbi:uncharacterized protein LOC103477167 isoform X1 [Poecilia reticulata]|uniref:uncharacterized protein LOC103477167 isoform X1 n=1 Tax=Poecilia reticulata TaxID=8081 RepID=UPI0004A42B1F|nr:PREDICTED: uncharacterized protein LOC103477167 isoform X1 [Poecilia reticulata]